MEFSKSQFYNISVTMKELKFRKINIIYLTLLSAFVLGAIAAYIFAAKVTHLNDIEHSVMGLLLIVSSIPHLIIFVKQGGINNKKKTPYAILSILGIGLGIFAAFAKNVELDLICLIWGIFDICRSTFEIFDTLPEIFEKKWLEVIEIVISIFEIVIAIFLILDKYEGIKLHYLALGISFSVYFVKFLLEGLLKKHEIQ